MLRLFIGSYYTCHLSIQGGVSTLGYLGNDCVYLVGSRDRFMALWFDGLTRYSRMLLPTYQKISKFLQVSMLKKGKEEELLKAITDNIEK